VGKNRVTLAKPSLTLRYRQRKFYIAKDSPLFIAKSGRGCIITRIQPEKNSICQ